MAFSAGEYLEKFILPFVIHELQNTKADFMAMIPEAPARAIDKNGIAVHKVGNPIAVDWNRVTQFVDGDVKDFLVENNIIPWEYFSTIPFGTDKEEIRTSALDRKGILNSKSADAIRISRRDKTLHAMAPDDDQNQFNPFARTTGADRGDGATRRLQVQDLILFSEQYNKLDLTERMKVFMVLCPEHLTDIMIDALNYQNFKEIYAKTATGEPINQYSFGFFHNNKTINYAADNTKKALGAALIGTDRPASIAFYAPHAIKALQSVQYHYTPMEDDTRNNPPKDEARWTGNHVGNKLYDYGFGALVSGNVV